MSVTAIDSTSNNNSAAQSELEKYQQKLSQDLAAKAAAKVAETDHDRIIAEDRAAVLRAQQAVQREEQTAKREKEDSRTSSISGFKSKLDISI
jgi:hypothetical protein